MSGHVGPESITCCDPVTIIQRDGKLNATANVVRFHLALLSIRTPRQHGLGNKVGKGMGIPVLFSFSTRILEYIPSNRGPTETGPVPVKIIPWEKPESLVYRWGYCSTAVISPLPRNRLTGFVCGVFPLNLIPGRIWTGDYLPGARLHSVFFFSLARIMLYLITQEFGSMSSLSPPPSKRCELCQSDLTYLVDEMNYLVAN